MLLWVHLPLGLRKTNSWQHANGSKAHSNYLLSSSRATGLAKGLKEATGYAHPSSTHAMARPNGMNPSRWQGRLFRSGGSVRGTKPFETRQASEGEVSTTTSTVQLRLM